MNPNGMCCHNNQANYCPTCATLQSQSEFASQDSFTTSIGIMASRQVELAYDKHQQRIYNRHCGRGYARDMSQDTSSQPQAQMGKRRR
jgi:hypothetical protein